MKFNQESYTIAPFKVPSLPETEDLFRLVSDYDKRMFAICQYLTGGRPSELCRHKVLDKEGRVKGVRSGIRRSDFWIEKRDGLDFLMIRKRVLKKRKGKAYNVVPVLFDRGDMAFALVKTLWEFIDKHDPDEEIFPFDRWQVWDSQKPMVKELQDKFGLTDSKDLKHFLRHIRATHLKRYYGFDPYDMMNFFQWSNTVPAAFYIHLEKGDLMHKLSVPLAKDDH